MKFFLTYVAVILCVLVAVNGVDAQTDGISTRSNDAPSDIGGDIDSANENLGGPERRKRAGCRQAQDGYYRADTCQIRDDSATPAELPPGFSK